MAKMAEVLLGLAAALIRVAARSGRRHAVGFGWNCDASLHSSTDLGLVSRRPISCGSGRAPRVVF